MFFRGSSIYRTELKQSSNMLRLKHAELTSKQSRIQAVGDLSCGLSMFKKTESTLLVVAAAGAVVVNLVEQSAEWRPGV